MDLDEEIRSREEGEIGSESREKGDLLPCSSPLRSFFVILPSWTTVLLRKVYNDLPPSARVAAERH